MTPKEWSVEAFEMCDHAGMICMNCAEEAIRGAIEEQQAMWLSEVGNQNGDDDLLRKGVPSFLKSPA